MLHRTPLRVINSVKVVSGYLAALLTGKPHPSGKPLAASIETNNTCNLHCPECPSGTRELTRPRGKMDNALFRSVIDQLCPELNWLTLYFQGEPYMNPDFFDFITYARSRKIYVSTSTNGHFLDEKRAAETVASGLNRLIISLDGYDQESYQRYRKGGNFDQVTNGISLLVNEKRKQKAAGPTLTLQCLVLRSNEHHLREIRELGHRLGVDRVVFKSAQFNDFASGNPLMPETLKYSRYLPVKHSFNKNNPESNQYEQCSPQTFRVRNPLPDRCFRMWSSCVITWDGKVLPCCYDKDADHVMGDLHDDSMMNIWQSDRYQSFRKRIFTARRAVRMCTNCMKTI